MKLLKTFAVDDDAKRGPLAMARLRFHPTAPILLGACADRRLAMWDIKAEATKKKNIEGVFASLVCGHDAGWIRNFVVDPKGKFIVTGSSDRRLRLWSWEDGKPSEKPVADVAAHDGWVEGVALSPDASKLVSVGADLKIKIWETASLKLLETATAHKKFPRDVLWAKDQIISGGEDGAIIVWDAATLKTKQTLDYGDANDQQGQTPSVSGVHSLALSADGLWLAAGGAKQAKLFEMKTGGLVGVASSFGMDVAFDPKTGLFAVGENVVSVFKIEFDKLTPQKQPELKPGQKPAPQKTPNLPGKALGEIKRGDFSLGMSFAADGRLAVGKSSGQAELWEV